VPLSTSSSERRRRSPLADLAWFAGAFLAVTGATVAWWTLAPHRPPPFTPPASPSDDFYVATDSLDHIVLSRGWGDTLRRLKAADVLFLGNSRVMLGFARTELAPTFDRLGLKYYLLGFGHTEGDQFPLAIIRKFNLRPRVVVINADPFFVGGVSPFARQVNGMSAFDAHKALFEGAAHNHAVTEMRRVLPHWPDVADGPVTHLPLYRARSDGAWLGPTDFAKTTPIREGIDAPPGPVPEARLLLARQFKAEMDARGTQMVLTCVPSPAANPRQAEEFARYLGVPFVAPTVDGLETFDRNHLTPASARRFTSAFAAAVEPVLAGMSPGQPAIAAAGRK
jgi:hypothetical protein